MHLIATEAIRLNNFFVQPLSPLGLYKMLNYVHLQCIWNSLTDLDEQFFVWMLNVQKIT